MKSSMFMKPAFVRISPFVAFMAFIAVEEILRGLLFKQVLNFDATYLYWLYLPKAALVALMLLMFRRHYVEIIWEDFRDLQKTLLSVTSGLLVFVLWIKMDWSLGSQHSPAGFNPEVFHEESVRWTMILVRITGAVIVVPIMEEIFWRSFLLRYLINAEFTTVAIGKFSLFSFVAVSVLFGLEHHYVFAGVMAGILFNCVYYYTRSIAHCILSHAIANFSLALYVLRTDNWRFW